MAWLFIVGVKSSLLFGKVPPCSQHKPAQISTLFCPDLIPRQA